VTLVLRPYQQELVAKVSAAFGNGAASVLLQSGTGSGKTATASEILARAVVRGYRSLFLAHLDTLLEDTWERLAANGLRVGYVQAGRPSDPEAPVQVASLQTLHVRGERPPGQLVIVDEAHRAMSASIRGVLDAYPQSAILGLSATPQRADGRPLGDVFERLICGPSNKWLTAQGYLVPCEILAPSGYQEQALAVDPVEAYLAHAAGLRAVVFATNRAHARVLVARFIERGVAADLIIGETSRHRRRELRSLLSSGELKVLVGVSVFQEGFDLPEIEVVELARAFGPTGAFLQAIGRGLRPSPSTGKTRLLVLDLRGIECLAVFRPAKVCPRCGASCKAAPKLPRVLSRAEKLWRFDALPQETRDARYLGRLVWVAMARMRMEEPAAQKWARATFLKRFGRQPEEVKRAG
jgi:superfamily II DNA or RNA helicase